MYLLYHWVLGVSAPRVQVSDGHELYGRLMCRDELVTNASVPGIWLILAVRPGSENRGVTVYNILKPWFGFFELAKKPPTMSYTPIAYPSFTGFVFSVRNALGIIAFAFRGHNLVLKIQATMPSTFKHPAHVPMWIGVKVAYILVVLCMFPMALARRILGLWKPYVSRRDFKCFI